MPREREPGGALLGALMLACLIVCACVLPPCTTHAQVPLDPLTQKVESWLSAGIEPAGVHDRLLALGFAGEHALQQIFEREAAARFVRLRALGMLQSFETETAALYFAALVRAAEAPDASLGDLHPARSPLVLRRALEGLREHAQLLGTRLSAGDVSACLSHHDAHVRRAAAQLAETLTQDASEPSELDRALVQRRAHERSRMVRASVDRALHVRASSRAARAPATR